MIRKTEHNHMKPQKDKRSVYIIQQGIKKRYVINFILVLKNYFYYFCCIIQFNSRIHLIQKSHLKYQQPHFSLTLFGKTKAT